jgi:hypothetical protein
MTALELQERLRAVDPRVLVVAERHLNRLLRRRQDRGIPTVLAVDIPHRFPRDELLADDQIAERISSEQIFEYFVVVDPHDLVIGQATEPEMLRFYWRMLFAEAIERAVRNLNAAPVPQLLHEARHLLETDHRIPLGLAPVSRAGHEPRQF